VGDIVGADARRILPIKVPGYRRRGRTHLELFPPRGHEDHSPYDVLFTTLVRARSLDMPAPAH